MIELRELSNHLLGTLGRATDRDDVRVFLANGTVYHYSGDTWVDETGEKFLESRLRTNWGRYCLIYCNHVTYPKDLWLGYVRCLKQLEEVLPAMRKIHEA